jgi:hypothetical protein
MKHKIVGFGQRPRPLYNNYHTPEREILSVGERPVHITVANKFVTAPLLKRLRKGRFNSETAAWIQKRLNFFRWDF